MKNVLALLLIAVLAFLTMTYVIDNNLIPEYGEARLDQTVSGAYVTQSVTEKNDNVSFGRSDNLELGSANAVTNIVLGYRAFDTLGEVTVLFVAALGVSLLLSSSEGFAKRSKSGFILKVGSKIILPIVIIVGVYIITHGHLSPGGGFQGGAMIAAALLLMAISDPQFIPSIKQFKLLEGLSGTIFIILGLVGISVSGYFLSNYMDTGIIGTLTSAGIIPVLYMFIGLKVGSELISIITDFLREEAECD